MKQKKFLWMLAAILTICGFASCSNDGNPTNSVADMEGTVLSYNVYGGAMLSFTAEQMTEAGFTLGDVVSIIMGGQTIDMPYYDGYYGRTGDYMLVAYPSYSSVCLTRNNIGLPAELQELEGQTVIVRLKQKGGSLDVQQALSMTYTNIREDYPSDDVFANARAVNVGQLAHNRLHRSSSPFDNSIGRAQYVSQYLEREQVKTVLNLADTEELMGGYNMPSYSRSLWEGGDVILCQLKADPTADDFNNRLIAALKVLPSHPGPYVVHCMEGKDRTGYVCALLEGLCGATYDEIVADYLVTYDNYFQKNPGNAPDVCQTLVSMRLNSCLMYYAGVSDEAQLSALDYKKVFTDYLLSHGMPPEQLQMLVEALTTS